MDKMTERQKKLLKELRDGGPISIRGARAIRALDSLKILHRYGMVTNTTSGFALSAAGFREVSTWA